MAKTPIRLVDTRAEPDTHDDFLLAQMLQLEFDREHDSLLTAEEKHYNKHSKGLTTQYNVMSCLIILVAGQICRYVLYRCITYVCLCVSITKVRQVYSSCSESRDIVSG